MNTSVFQRFGNQAVQRTRAIVRQQRDGVGQQRCTGLEIGVCDGGNRGGQAAAQAIDDGDDAHLSCRVEHALERFETFGSVALEHRRLEFDCCGAPVGGLQHTHGEEFGAFGVDVVSPVGEELAMRVNAHTQRPVFGH